MINLTRPLHLKAPCYAYVNATRRSPAQAYCYSPGYPSAPDLAGHGWDGPDRGDPPWGPRPLRVAHVGQSLVRAGVEQWLKAMIRFLDPRWAQIVRCVVTEQNLVDPEVAREVGITVEIGGAAEVRRTARDCDVLLCWGPSELGQWLADCPAKLCLYIAHGEGMWTQRTLRDCQGVLDHIVAVSQRVRDRVCPGEATTVIHNGVDAAHVATTCSRRAARQALGFTDDDFVLGFVGRFAPEKRAHGVIEAAALLPPKFKALLVGWGPLDADLRALAASWLGGRAAFVTAGSYVGDYYQAMDALCMISEAEGFSMAALEAMMCGVPLVATSVGFIPEAIRDRVNGLVVSGTIDSICQAAEWLAAYPAWARAIAAEGQAYAREFGHARSMAAKYEHLLARLWQEKFVLGNS